MHKYNTLTAAMPSALAITEKPLGPAPLSCGARSGMSISSTTTARSCDGENEARTTA